MTLTQTTPKPFSQFDVVTADDHEAVVVCSDAATGLRGYIALHNTVLGPGMGGVRIRQYPTEQAALEDVLNLSRAMTFKNSLAGLNFGGAKAVIIADPHTDKTPELLRAFAHRINLLQGTYVTASDLGSTAADLDIMRTLCQWVPCKPKARGGLGDSAPLTSVGVFGGLKAAVKVRLGKDDLTGLHVGVEGVGKVGAQLVSYLIEAGCTVTISDTYQPAIDAVLAKHPQVKAVSTEQLSQEPLDVFSPNGIGGTITEAVANHLQASVVAGGANNPLARRDLAEVLHQRDILFAPDFVVNAGGVITIAAEMEGRTWESAEEQSKAIYNTTLSVLTRAKENDMLPLHAAIAQAQQRIDIHEEQSRLRS